MNQQEFDIQKLIGLVRKNKFEVTVAGFAVLDKLDKIDVSKKIKSRKSAVQTLYVLSENQVKYDYISREQRKKLQEEAQENGKAREGFDGLFAPPIEEDSEEEFIPEEEKKSERTRSSSASDFGDEDSNDFEDEEDDFEDEENDFEDEENDFDEGENECDILTKEVKSELKITNANVIHVGNNYIMEIGKVEVVKVEDKKDFKACIGILESALNNKYIKKEQLTNADISIFSNKGYISIKFKNYGEKYSDAQSGLFIGKKGGIIEELAEHHIEASFLTEILNENDSDSVITYDEDKNGNRFELYIDGGEITGSYVAEDFFEMKEEVEKYIKDVFKPKKRLENYIQEKTGLNIKLEVSHHPNVDDDSLWYAPSYLPDEEYNGKSLDNIGEEFYLPVYEEYESNTKELDNILTQKGLI
ncbi:MAG: hypothetical protein H7A23_06795 [Leptospiraceae bacterium]|nr:hypothetical protein [Leptospiraceae bacterium]MCP5494248.1 hypothetical protein [Leptospiraceae bacterium]